MKIHPLVLPYPIKTNCLASLFAAAALSATATGVAAPQLKAKTAAVKPKTAAAKKLPQPPLETVGGGTIATGDN